MAKKLFQTKNTEEQSCEILFLWMKSALFEGTLKEEESNLLSLSKNTAINESARYESLRWLAKLAVRNGDIEKAETYALSIPSKSLMGREILFDVADEIMENWGDLGKASSVLNKITDRYTDKETLKEKQFVLSLYTDNKYAYPGSNNNEPQATESRDNSANLSEAYPNPFNPTTTISYSITNDGLVIIKVYDILGREIATLANEEKPVGTYRVNFNGDRLASGIYFYSLQTNGKVITKKMLLIK
jgi:Secretion system C-terminal sorting domain